MAATLDDVVSMLSRMGAASPPKWASAEYVHSVYGVNHMTLRKLAGVKVRCRKLADNDVIAATPNGNVVYRVRDVEEWLDNSISICMHF